MNKITVKIISAILILAIVLTNNYSYAHSTLFKTTSHAQRYLAQNEPKEQLSIIKDPSTISIPQQIGTVLEYYKGKGDALIIHIQDRHADPMAQLNISAIIDEFIQKHKVSLMMLEGASSELDTSFYDSFEDNEIKQKVSKLFVNYAIFTGAEHYKITNKDKYLRAIGAEDRSLYLKHLDIHKNTIFNQESILNFLKAVNLSLNSLKDTLYTKDQKKIDNSSNLYSQGSIRFPEYIKTLNSVAKKTKTGLDKYENLFKFISLVQKEEKIDFKQAESQREAIIKKLSGILNKIDLSELLRKSMEFRTAILSQEEFYDYLFNLIYAQDFKTSEYNHLSAYVEYIKLSKDINHLKAFDEADDFEYEIMLHLSTTQPQKDLILYSKSAKLLKGLYSLKLTPRQLSFLEKYKEASDISNIKRFLIRTSSQYGINLFPIIISFSIDSSLMNQSKQYYSLALERDNALIKNTLERMKHLRKDKAILIAGGFHTQGITNTLKQKGISYVVICPNISQKEFDVIYNNRIEGRLPGAEELESALANTLSPKLQTDIRPDGVIDKASSSGVKELFRTVLLSASLVARQASPEISPKLSSAGGVAPEAAYEDEIPNINSEDITRHNLLDSEVYEVTIKGGDGTLYIEKQLYNSPISSGENELMRLQKLAKGNVKMVPRLIAKVRYPDQERLLIERIDGEMLADVIKDADMVKGLLDSGFISKLRNIVSQAHDAGIAHGDIQERNVIVASNGTPVLIDWDAQTYNDDLLVSAKQLDLEELGMLENLCKDIVSRDGAAVDPKASSAGDTSARRALPLTVNIEADMLEKISLRLAQSVEAANRGLTDRGMDGVVIIDSAVLFRSEINTLLEQLASLPNFEKMTEHEKMQLPVYRRFIKVIHYIELYQYDLEWVKRYIDEADTADNVSSLLYHKSFLDANIAELSKIFQSPVTEGEVVVRYLDAPKKLFATHATQPDYLVLMAISGLMDFRSARDLGVKRKSGGVLDSVSFQVGQVQRFHGQEPNPYPYGHELHNTFSEQGYSHFQMTTERDGGQYGVFIPYSNLLRNDKRNHIKLYTNSSWYPFPAGVMRRKILELGRDGAEEWIHDIDGKITDGKWAQAYIDGDVSMWPSADNHSYNEMMRAVKRWREIGVAQTGYEPIFVESSQKGETQGEIETNSGLNLHEEEAMLMVPRINLNKFVRDFLDTLQKLADAPGNTNVRDAIEKTGGFEQYARNALSMVVPYGESNLQLAMVTLEDADLDIIRKNAQEQVNAVLHSVFSAGVAVTSSIDDRQDLGVIVSDKDKVPSDETKASSAGQALKYIAELRTSIIKYLESVRNNPYDNHFGLPQYGLIIYDSTLREDTIDVIKSLASLRNFRGEYVFEIVVVPSKNGRNLIGKIQGNIRTIAAGDVEEEAKGLMIRKPVGIIAGAEVGDVAGLAMEIESAKRRNGDNWYVFVTSQVPVDIEIKGLMSKDFVAFEPMLADILGKFKNYNSLKERLDRLTLREKLDLLCEILPALTDPRFMERIEALREVMDMVAKAA